MSFPKPILENAMSQEIVPVKDLNNIAPIERTDHNTRPRQRRKRVR